MFFTIACFAHPDVPDVMLNVFGKRAFVVDRSEEENSEVWGATFQPRPQPELESSANEDVLAAREIKRTRSEFFFRFILGFLVVFIVIDFNSKMAENKAGKIWAFEECRGCGGSMTGRGRESEFDSRPQPRE